MSSPIPKTGTRSTIDAELKAFLDDHKDLRLGGANDPRTERAHHLEVFGFHSLPKQLRAPIGRVEDIAIPGPHGTIPVRAFYPTSGEARAAKKDAAALVYFHGGGYTVGSVDEFENASRLIAEAAEAQVYTVEYRLAPEWSFPVQLDEYDTVVDWLQGNGGKERGVNPSRVCGGGDSAGGNMTAAVSLRRLDNGKPPLKAQILLYPEARLPFDTLAAAENNSGMYLECKAICSVHFLFRTGLTYQRQRHICLCKQLCNSWHSTVSSIRLTRHARCVFS